MSDDTDPPTSIWLTSDSATGLVALARTLAADAKQGQTGPDPEWRRDLIVATSPDNTSWTARFSRAGERWDMIRRLDVSWTERDGRPIIQDIQAHF